MSSCITVHDRAAVVEANELIARYGEYAGSEAAMRADKSRAVGNVIHFCKLREVERLIAMLRGESGSGTLH